MQYVLLVFLVKAARVLVLLKFTINESQPALKQTKHFGLGLDLGL